NWPVYGRISGPVVIIGFGSIGRGFLPLLKRHFTLDQPEITIIEPSAEFADLMAKEGATHVQAALTPHNYREILTPLLTRSEGQGCLVYHAVDTGSVDIMTLTRDGASLYIDTVVGPWAGFYDAGDVDAAVRSNYALREALLAARRANPG